MRHPGDTHGIIPNGASHGMVRPFDFQVRTLVEYDMNFLTDRVRSDIFINGNPAGVYGCVRVDDSEFGSDREGLQRAMEAYAPDLERSVIDEFMGLGYRRQVRALETELRDLKAYVNRDRWWHFRPVRNAWGRVVSEVNEARRQFAAVIAPKGGE